MAPATTMKLSTETRNRLRALAGADDSLEDVVVSALDAYESQQFWAAATAAAAAEGPAQRAERQRLEADVDSWMDGLR